MIKKTAGAEGELNVANRTLFICDNVGVLDGMNSECADLIYLDPPFNSNRHYSAPIDSRAAGAAFKDAWTLDDIDLAWVGQIAERHPGLAAVINAAGLAGGKGDKAYLIFMARRVLEMHRILKATGSIYLHCDPTMSHSLKMLMDSVFGKRQFRNEVIWSYNRFSRRGGAFPSMSDTILFYGKGRGALFNKLPVAARDATRYEKGYHTVVDDGVKRLLVYDRKKAADKIAAAKKEGTAVAHTKSQSPSVGNVWGDIPIINPMAKERTGYPTQKPLALLERIIRASSDEGGVVLDPFCGCATALVAAERLNRRWIGVDISPKATDLIQTRLQNAQDMLTTKGAWKKVSTRRDRPARTDGGDLMVNPKEYRHELYGMQNGECAGCRHEFPFRNMTVDHKDADAPARTRNAKTNLQLLCGACNSVKGPRPMSYLLAYLKKHGIV
ncbi:MAG: DNA methyltransferase [Gammaproteobacteria bacterium]